VRAAERLRDTALLRHFVGDRAGAMLHGVAACVLDPTGPATWAAVRTIVRGSPSPR
jgi:hypothetical protein